MNGFEVHQIIVFNIDAQAEEKACISSINNFIISELDKIGVFCITDFSKIFMKKKQYLTGWTPVANTDGFENSVISLGKQTN